MHYLLKTLPTELMSSMFFCSVKTIIYSVLNVLCLIYAPYCTVLYCAILYCTVLCCTVLYHTVMYCTVLYHTVLYHTVPYCTVLYHTVLQVCMLVPVSWRSMVQYQPTETKIMILFMLVSVSQMSRVQFQHPPFVVGHK